MHIACLQSLRFVWISHKHADHHVGLLRILEIHSNHRRRYPSAGIPPLIVVAPAAILTFLQTLGIGSLGAGIASNNHHHHHANGKNHINNNIINAANKLDDDKRRNMPLSSIQCQVVHFDDFNHPMHPCRQWLHGPGSPYACLFSVRVNHCHEAHGIVSYCTHTTFKQL